MVSCFYCINHRELDAFKNKSFSIFASKKNDNEKELLDLNNLAEQYLIFAEGQAMSRIPMKMTDWINKLNGFLQLNDRDILTNSGKIAHELAIELAENEYDKFHKERLIQEASKDSDFEKVIGLTKNCRLTTCLVLF